MTDDAVPLWVTTRTTAIRGIAYAQGYRFAAHDALAMGARFSDIEPANQAARYRRRRDVRGPERPRWRARRLIQVDDRIVREGKIFQSYIGMPPIGILSTTRLTVAACQRETTARFSTSGLGHRRGRENDRSR